MKNKKIRNIECPSCKGIIREDVERCKHCTSKVYKGGSASSSKGEEVGIFIIAFFLTMGFAELFEKSLKRVFSDDTVLGIELTFLVATTILLIYLYAKKLDSIRKSKIVYVDEDEDETR